MLEREPSGYVSPSPLGTFGRFRFGGRVRHVYVYASETPSNVHVHIGKIEGVDDVHVHYL